MFTWAVQRIEMAMVPGLLALFLFSLRAAGHFSGERRKTVVMIGYGSAVGAAIAITLLLTA